MILKTKRKVTSIRISDEILEHAKDNIYIDSLSDWIEERYTKEFLKLKTYTSKLENLKDEQTYIKSQIKTIKSNEKDAFHTIPKGAKTWLKVYGRGRIRVGNMKAVYRFFCNEFHLKDLTFRQFRILTDKYCYGITK